MFSEYLWQRKVQTEFLFNGYSQIPLVNCKSVNIPNNISRKNEVLLLSLFYKNNLLNSSLFTINPQKFSFATCSYGCNELETTHHILASCIHNPYKVEFNEFLGSLEIDTFESHEFDFHINLLNILHNEKLLELCLKIIISNIHLKKSIQL